MAEKRSEAKGYRMRSGVVEASELVMSIAGAMPGDTIKRQIARASRRINFWSASRVKDAWYRNPKMRIDADELDRLRELANATPEATAAQREMRELQQRLERLEVALRVQTPDDYRRFLASRE